MNKQKICYLSFPHFSVQTNKPNHFAYFLDYLTAVLKGSLYRYLSESTVKPSPALSGYGRSKYDRTIITNFQCKKKYTTTSIQNVNFIHCFVIDEANVSLCGDSTCYRLLMKCMSRNTYRRTIIIS